MRKPPRTRLGLGRDSPASQCRLTIEPSGNVSSSRVRVGELFRDVARINATGVIFT